MLLLKVTGYVHITQLIADRSNRNLCSSAPCVRRHGQGSIPGKSNAFEISRKLGLSDSVIERAKQLLEGGDIAFEDVIASLEEDKKIAEEERDEAIAMNIEMKRMREELEEKIRKFERQKEKELERAREQAREIVREARQVSNEVKDELKELSKLESLGERNLAFDKNRRKLRELEKKNRSSIKRETSREPVDRSRRCRHHE